MVKMSFNKEYLLHYFIEARKFKSLWDTHFARDNEYTDLVNMYNMGNEL